MPDAPKSKTPKEKGIVLRWPEIKEHKVDEQFCREFILPKLSAIGLGRYSAMPGEGENPETGTPEPSIHEYFDWREDPKSTPDVFTSSEKTILAGFCDQQGILFERKKGGPKPPPAPTSEPSPPPEPVVIRGPVVVTGPDLIAPTEETVPTTPAEPVAEPVEKSNLSDAEEAAYLEMIAGADAPVSPIKPDRNSPQPQDPAPREAYSPPANGDSRTLALALVAFRAKADHRTFDQAVLDMGEQFGVENGLTVEELLRVARFAYEKPAK